MSFEAKTQKQPMKLLEVPLNKFHEEVIPHHQETFDNFKTKVLRHLLRNPEELQQDIRSKQQIVKQLKDLMYELDTLRTQVEDEDLDKFDTRTLSLRKIILNLISGYTDLERKITAEIAAKTEQESIESEESEHPFQGASQIQLQDDLEELRLRQRQALYEEVRTINQNAEDLNEIYSQIHGMVQKQGEGVNHIEESVESSQKNVNSGYLSLIKAHKLKTTMYPVTGAFIGSLVGGPIGLLAGFKIGGLAALGCAVAGYTGGKIFKKTTDQTETATSDKSDDKECKKDL